jgi:hypothetical protein
MGRQKLERVHGRIVGSLGGSDKGKCCGLAAQWNCLVLLQNHVCAHAREVSALRCTAESWWGWSDQQQSSGWQQRKEMFITSSYRKKMEKSERWAREEEERMRCEEEEDAKLRERGGRMAVGIMLDVAWRNLLTERGVAAIVIAAAATATTRAAALKRSTRIHQRAVERDERDQDNAKERGGQSLQDTREFRSRGHAGW